MDDIEKKSESLISEAYSRYASDIHVVPKETSADIYFRRQQTLDYYMSISKRTSERLISHFKFYAGMDIGERRKPQNGAMNISLREKKLDLRLSTLPTPFHESLVIRLLPQDETFHLQDLPVFRDSYEQLASLIHRKSGLVLLTGPTGAGKSTTLYALLYEAKRSLSRNIITLEEPIEKRTDSFIQMEINEKAGLSYYEGLKAILRHDPDIIMIGEIRDEQTAHLAVRAALTGHLVFSTLHTKNTLGAIERLLEFNIPVHEIEQTLIAVTAQRLVKRICRYCGEDCHRFCQELGRKRQAAIIEFLVGKSLEEALWKIKNNKILNAQAKTLASEIRKAIALGAISEKSYQQWIGDANEKMERLEKSRVSHPTRSFT